MCGICGIIPSSGDTIREMTTSLFHRGPDGEGYYEDETISLGHRRLAIIDLAKGDQPIYNEDGEICIVFNGEIYNYRDLRRELEKRHKFYTNSDTEVIVHLYEELGTGCLNRLNGMFAFAIWDKRERKLFLARDRMGIKPLYYTEDGIFAFASELKSLIPILKKKEIDPFALSTYLSLGYVLSPHTILRGVKKLPQGHFAVWKDGKVAVERYWEIGGDSSVKSFGDREEVVRVVRSLIDDAVRTRLHADVPLGVLLSGGLDSAVITAVASRYKPHLKTFTVGFESEGYDERKYARLVAESFNTDHRDILVGPQIEDVFHTVMDFVDEPIADEALVPTYLISRLASRDVKVVLTGEGGDESFGGYPRYLLSILSDKIGDVAFLRVVSRIFSPFLRERERAYLRRLFSGERDTLKRNLRWLSIFTEDEKRRLCAEKLSEFEFSGRGIESLFQFDLTRWLPDDVLQKLDRTTMANSIEGRVPLLDHQLVSYCAGIDSRLKLRGFDTKFLLKIAYRDVLPEKILRRRKHGFLSPFTEWFDDNFLHMCRSILSHSKFDPTYTREIIDNAKRDRGCAKKLWSLVVFELWRQKQKIDL